MALFFAYGVTLHKGTNEVIGNICISFVSEPASAHTKSVELVAEKAAVYSDLTDVDIIIKSLSRIGD